jgi:hypothetical protein
MGFLQSFGGTQKSHRSNHNFSLTDDRTADFSHIRALCPHLAVLLILPNCSGRPGTSALPCQISLDHPTGPNWAQLDPGGNLPSSLIMLDPQQDSEENWLTDDSGRRANHGLRVSTPDESTRNTGYFRELPGYPPKSIQKCSK